MRYYGTRRPLTPGAFPGKAMEIVNYDEKTYVEEIGMEAWGHVEYASPLAPETAKAYELTPEKKGREKTKMKKHVKEELKKYMKENNLKGKGRKIVYVNSPVRFEILGSILLDERTRTLNEILWFFDTTDWEEAEKDGYEVPDWEYEHYDRYINIVDPATLNS